MVDANLLFKLGAPANMQTAMQSAAQGQATLNELAQMPIRNQLLEAQAKGADLQNQKIARAIKEEDAAFVLRDVALDAMDVMPIIKRGNMAEFSAFMDSRIRKIEGRGGDATESRAFKEQMESGLISPDVALDRLQGAVEKARQAGVLDGASMAGNRSFAPVPMTDVNGNFAGYAVPTVDASGRATMQPISGSERALSPVDLAAARENIGVQGYGQRRQIEAQTAPIIAGGERRAQLGVESEIRPQLEAKIEESKTTAKLDAERKGSIIKAINDEKEVGRILDMAEPLLQKATESLAGVTIDAAGRLVGASTEGSRAAAQLKTLEGALIIKMPRMEGPQSNMDQQLYRQMAAQIGDAGTPSEERQAAVNILRMLNAKYTGQQGHAKTGNTQKTQAPSGAMRTAAGPGAKAVDAQMSDKIASPKTQADYDALPSGAVFVDPDDGKQYRKP